MKRISILLVAMLMLAAMPVMSFADESQLTKVEFIKQILDEAEVEIKDMSEPASVEAVDEIDVEIKDVDEPISTKGVYELDVEVKDTDQLDVEVKDIDEATSIDGIAEEYVPYVQTAYDKGIISQDEEVELNEPILKREAVVMLVKLFGEKINVEKIAQEDIVKELNRFTDIQHLDLQTKQHITYALKNDIIKENKGSFYPSMKLTEKTSKKMIDYAKDAHDKYFTRDGLSADEILTLANKKLEEDKTYKAKGAFDVNMKMNAEGLPADDDTAQELMNQSMNMDMTVELDMQVEAPDKVYMVQGMKSNVGDLQSEDTMESYMDGPTMYQKSTISGDKWIKTDMSSVYDKIQSLQGNNLQAMTNLTDEQLQIFKDYASYGENVKKNGKEYYIVNLDIDKQAFKKFYEEYTKEIMDAAIKASLQEQDEMTDQDQVEIEMAKQFVTQMINNMDMELNYKFYINKNTKRYESMDTAINMYMNMDSLVQMIAQMSKEDDVDFSKVKMEMVMRMEGQLEYCDFGEEITFPQITEDDIFKMEEIQVIEEEQDVQKVEEAPEVEEPVQSQE